MDFEALLTLPLVSAIGTLITIVGLPLSIYFYANSREIYALRYKVNRVTLFNIGYANKFLNIEYDIKVNGVSYKRLSRCFILIKNSGNRIVNASDFVREIKISTVLDSSDILDCRILFADDDSANPSLGRTSPRECVLNVDFLRPKEGVVLMADIGHNDESDRNAVKISGSIRQEKIVKDLSKDIKIRITSYFLLLVIPTIFSAITVYNSPKDDIIYLISSAFNAFVFSILGVCILVFGIIYIYLKNLNSNASTAEAFFYDAEFQLFTLSGKPRHLEN